METRSNTWSSFLDTIVECSAWDVLRNILESARLPLPLSINHSKIFDVSKSWASSIAQGSGEHSLNIASVLIHWGAFHSSELCAWLIFISDVCLEDYQIKELLETINSSFVRESQGLAYAPDLQQSARILESTSAVMLAILKAENAKSILESSGLDRVELGAWLLVLPALASALSQQLSGISAQCEEARKHWLVCTYPDMHTSAEAVARATLAGLLTNHETPLRCVCLMFNAGFTNTHAVELVFPIF